MSEQEKQITIVPVTTRRQLRRFARFNRQLYKGSAYNVPDLDSDVMDMFTPSRNAALEFCQAQPFLAVMDGKVVGRVAAIINPRANKVWKTDTVRFGWIDFIDDIRVSGALMDAVAQWGRERGMNRIDGPLGFTDFDPEGMLTWGFDKLATMATIYNYPYYPEHMEKLGLTPSARWAEWHIPYNGVPEKMQRLSRLVLERYDLHLAETDNIRHVAKKYGHDIFHLINEAFAPLYGYSAFSEKQIDDFVRRYLPLVDVRFISIVLDRDDRVVAVGVTMPSLSRALQKADGRLFPLGWWHMLKALKWKQSDTLDLLFLAVKPEYQNKGINAVPFSQIVPRATGAGFIHGESNPELDTNCKMQSHWSYFVGTEIHKRRAVFCKDI